MCCGGSGWVVAVHELVELRNELVGAWLKNVIVEIAEIEKFFCFVAEAGGEVVFVEVVIHLEVAEVGGRIFHGVKFLK